VPLTLEPLEARENPAVVNTIAFQFATQDLQATVRDVLTSSTPPSAASINNLIVTTAVALNDQIVTQGEQAQILLAVGRILNEANVPIDRLARIVADIQIIRSSVR
jgi:hypothetical protein